MLDMDNNPLDIGDTVVYSDSGRGGSVHVGTIHSGVQEGYGCYAYRLYIKDRDTNRINRRYASQILKYKGVA
jgi:hypothetical protein